jgi:hypothetical protein
MKAQRIALDEQERIFERLYRGDHARADTGHRARPRHLPAGREMEARSS